MRKEMQRHIGIKLGAMNTLSSKPHMTAKYRKSLPKPTKYLLDNGLIQGKVLDYGCGMCHEINNQYFAADGYDPYFRPILPSSKYDTIICNYVLNVVDEDKRKTIFKQLKNLSLPNTKIYLTVRRDIKEDYKTKNTEQYVVNLPLKSVLRTKNFEIYLLDFFLIPTN